MKEPIEYQIIEHDGMPAFVLVPYEHYRAIKPYLAQRKLLRDTIPHSVVEANIVHDVPIIKAWREHLGLTQTELAQKASMKQSALARIESGSVLPRHSTILKLSAAMGVNPELLTTENEAENFQIAA